MEYQPSDMSVPCDSGIINLRVGAIIVKENKILMVKNNKHDYYYSVGGRIKFGETAEEAIIREVYEETGTYLTINRLTCIHENYFYGDASSNLGKLIYEVSFFFLLNTPDDFEPICTSFTEDGNPESLCWVSPETDEIIYPHFFRTEALNPSPGVKYFVSDERTKDISLQKNDTVPSADSKVSCETFVCPDNNSQSGPINKNTSLDERVMLYMTLFHGRDDVYAYRWENQKTGKTGYSPACENIWKPGICPLPQIKCPQCDHASYSPYTAEAVKKHLSKQTKDVFGIYAIQPDDTCWFLAIDMDEASWESDVHAIRQVCSSFHIPCAVEKSRSGNGAHVWFFFSSPVPAATARRMGSSIVTAAMQSNSRLSFASYDRMFPNQDTMPKGGFGNLIALPLQPAAARSCGGSLFIDDDGNAFPDQWAYLSSLHKMSLYEVEAAISQIGIPLLGSLIPEGSEEKPWNRHQGNLISQDDPTKSIHCVIADRIYISTDGVSSAVQNNLKRLAAFRNPEFYQKQAMRMPVWETPRIICCAEYNGNYLCMPRGCTESINSWAAENHISVSWQDEQTNGREIHVSFRGTLYTEQEIAFEVMKQNDKGVLSATTAFGKTVLAAALIAEKKVNTLILVHRKNLLDQWKERLQEFLDIQDVLPDLPPKRGRKRQRSVIGIYGAGKDVRSGIIDIAMMQSIEKKNEIPEWIEEYGMVIVDECHHVPAVSFEAVLKRVRAKYTYGLTATPKRKDGHHPIIPMYLGPIRYRVDAKEQAAQRPFRHVMIPRFTGMVFSSSSENEVINIASYYNQIAEDEIRNHLIVDDVISCLEEGRNCLVLSERVAHVQTLSSLIQQTYPHVFVLIGGQVTESGHALQKIRSASSEQPIVICATGKYIGEGFDESRLDTLFLAMPVSFEGILAQYAGRLHRLHDGKTEVRVYDYIDDQAVMLERMYNKRLRTYSNLGYQVCAERSDTNISNDIIYDQKTFIEPFLADIRKARKSIVIVSPFIKERRVEWLYRQIKENVHPVQVTVVTRPSDSFQGKTSLDVSQAIRQLQNNNASILCKEAIHQKFAIIDEKIVWYGSINLLSFGASQESIIRILSGSVARTLVKSVDIAQ